MMTEHRCLFCDHVFVGRRRKFCWDCLPAHDSVHPKVYNARYQELYRACGLHPAGSFPSSSWTPPGGWPRPPQIPRPPKPLSTCIECSNRCATPFSKYCSPRCRRAHVRHAVRTAPIPSDPARPLYVATVVAPPQKLLRSRSNRRDIRSLVAAMPEGGECRTCSAALRPWWTLYPGMKPRRICYDCTLSRTRARYRNKIQIRESGAGTYGSEILCLVCNGQFRRTVQRKLYCSDSCRKQAESDKNRRQNFRRRGAKQGEPYTLRMIVDRSGCSCHLCGRIVDLSLSGSVPAGPTIDHLVPLSAGGLDCFSNVALAHRKCNVERGADGPAQLRLVG